MIQNLPFVGHKPRNAKSPKNHAARAKHGASLLRGSRLQREVDFVGYYWRESGNRLGVDVCAHPLRSIVGVDVGGIACNQSRHNCTKRGWDSQRYAGGNGCYGLGCNRFLVVQSKGKAELLVDPEEPFDFHKVDRHKRTVS